MAKNSTLERAAAINGKAPSTLVRVTRNPAPRKESPEVAAIKKDTKSARPRPGKGGADASTSEQTQRLETLCKELNDAFDGCQAYQVPELVASVRRAQAMGTIDQADADALIVSWADHMGDQHNSTDPECIAALSELYATAKRLNLWDPLNMRPLEVFVQSSEYLSGISPREEFARGRLQARFLRSWGEVELAERMLKADAESHGYTHLLSLQSPTAAFRFKANNPPDWDDVDGETLGALEQGLYYAPLIVKYGPGYLFGCLRAWEAAGILNRASVLGMILETAEHAIGVFDAGDDEGAFDAAMVRVLRSWGELGVAEFLEQFPSEARAMQSAGKAAFMQRAAQSPRLEISQEWLADARAKQKAAG